MLPERVQYDCYDLSRSQYTAAIKGWWSNVRSPFVSHHGKFWLVLLFWAAMYNTLCYIEMDTSILDWRILARICAGKAMFKSFMLSAALLTYSRYQGALQTNEMCKSSTMQTPSNVMNSYFIFHCSFYFDTGICMWYRTRVVRILSFAVCQANTYTSMSKITSIVTGSDSMRLAGGWASPFRLHRGLHTHTLDKLKVAWFPCLHFQTLLPPTLRMSARSPYSGPHRKLVLAFDVGTTFSGISYWPV